MPRSISATIRSRRLSPDAPMLPVSVPLNQVARARAGSRADHRALLPADQSTSHRSCDSANDGAFGLTVVMPVRATMREALRGSTKKYKHE